MGRNIFHLSGGEKQTDRNCQAASFTMLRSCLLDEPTSNLDSLNESIILHSLEELGTDKTVLIVSHRESTMAAAILFMKCPDGCLTEARGSRNSLFNFHH